MSDCIIAKATLVSLIALTIGLTAPPAEAGLITRTGAAGQPGQGGPGEAGGIGAGAAAQVGEPIANADIQNRARATGGNGGSGGDGATGFAGGQGGRGGTAKVAAGVRVSTGDAVADSRAVAGGGGDCSARPSRPAGSMRRRPAATAATPALPRTPPPTEVPEPGSLALMLGALVLSRLVARPATVSIA